ncbi:MAG TPA: hypothetical protein VHR47_09135, partial [Bacillota bacterium]|nr:hypothetical protein [Bacillota bacterium]
VMLIAVTASFFPAQKATQLASGNVTNIRSTKSPTAMNLSLPIKHKHLQTVDFATSPENPFVDRQEISGILRNRVFTQSISESYDNLFDRMKGITVSSISINVLIRSLFQWASLLYYPFMVKINILTINIGLFIEYQVNTDH